MHYFTEFWVTLALASSAIALPTFLRGKSRSNAPAPKFDYMLFDGPAFPDPANPGNTLASLQAFVSRRRTNTGILAKAVTVVLRTKGIKVIGEQATNLKKRVNLITVLGLSREQVKVHVDGCSQSATLQETAGFSNLGLVRQNVSLGSCAGTHHSLTATVQLPEGDHRSVKATIFRSPNSGYGVISDIDDTVKISHVLDKKALIRSTLLDEPKAVSGMPELYTKLSQTLKDPQFVYVSGSPFQLYPFLHEFIDSTYTTAKGPIMLQNLTVFDPRDVIEFIASSSDATYKHKMDSITTLRSFYPKKKWMMIGDSTQKDPEVYGRIYKRFPDMLLCAWIRQVENADNTPERFAKAFKDVPKNKWRTAWRRHSTPPPDIMKIAVFGARKYDIDSFDAVNPQGGDLQFTYIDALLDQTTVVLATGHQAVCLFVNDVCNAVVVERLNELGVKYIVLRCAGFNNIDLAATEKFGIKVARVPAYSPEAVAEFAVGMMLTVIRKYHKAYNRVREGNFLLDGLLGFNLHGKKIGLIGTGKIGLLTGKILSKGFGADVIAYDPYPSPVAEEYGIKYVPTLDDLLSTSDIISLHCPLMDSTKYIINEDTLKKTKKGVVLINTSRGGLINTYALIGALKSGHIGAVGLDVYEGESAYFFADSSSKIITDDVFSRLLTFYNVFVTGHQAFLTQEALQNIAETTLTNLRQLEETGSCACLVKQ
ncbi:hypothetical protein CVT24_007197 [Panaeolus cyanescens]|uniref:D-lactate dehydrogenase n=1 Tax=Panaeolus cyanescens TaxID=181874 RepID=A0A409VJJ3_9AGAR|nr:hypothetical protein CVT24_007197 [Panaeolus cyanescens]